MKLWRITKRIILEPSPFDLDNWIRDTFYAAPDSIIPIEYRRKLKVRRKKIWNSTFNTIEYDTRLE